MSYKIKVNPSGHLITAESRESLLRAGLREGLNLSHSCANGSCGECKARLLNGELERIRFHDFRFSEQEETDNWFLMCCHRAGSDMEIEAHEYDHAEEIPRQQIKARVSKVERLQDDVILLQLRTPRSQNLHFLAGQNAELHLSPDVCELLPIGSCPCDGMNLRFHLRREESEPFSLEVFNNIKKGDVIDLVGPMGGFVLNEASERPIIFVAWETTFAQVASMIDHVIQIDEEREIHLYWLSAIPRGHYLSNYCRAWGDVLDNFHYHSIDLEPVGEWTFETIFQEIGSQHVPLSDWDLYVATPPSSDAAIKYLIDECSLPDTQLVRQKAEHN